MRGARLAVAAYLLTLAALLILIIIYSPLTISPDEAHYWEWSRNLDYAYFSKGPLVAWLIRGSRAIFGETPLAVRFPALCSYLLFLLCSYVFVSRLSNSRIGFLAVVVFSSMLIFSQMGILMTTDGPAALFWLLGSYFAHRATIEKKSLSGWLGFGVCIGFGIWAKYTVSLLLLGVLIYLLVSPARRWEILSRDFLFGVFVIALFLLPIIVWNVRHEWVNITHNAGHLVGKGGIDLRYFFELIFAQWGLVGPVAFIGIIYGLVLSLRQIKDDTVALFLLSSLTVFVVVIFVSLTRRVYANWPMPAYISSLLCIVSVMKHNTELKRAINKYLIPAVGINFILVILAHGLLFGFTYGVAGKLLPSKRLVGWDMLSKRVESELAKSDKEVFIVSGTYGFSSVLSFYLSSRPFVYCAEVGGRRLNQYDIWERQRPWSAMKGRDALLVLKKEDDTKDLSQRFQALIPVADNPEINIEYSGSIIYQFRLYWGINYDGIAL